MRVRKPCRLVMAVAALLAIGCSDGVTAPGEEGGLSGDGGPVALPVPVLAFREVISSDGPGGEVLTYLFEVVNRDEFPAELFEARPDLPPCGLNEAASRTWLHFHDDQGRRIYGYCALRGPEDMASVGFGWPADRVGTAPEEITIRLHDRLLDRTVESNRVPVRT